MREPSGPGNAATDTTALLERALEAGVAFVPGDAYGISHRHGKGLRLSFATPSPAEIIEVVHRLADAVDRLR